jgi:hypothetical protein
MGGFFILFGPVVFQCKFLKCADASNSQIKIDADLKRMYVVPQLKLKKERDSVSLIYVKSTTISNLLKQRM